jgi:hypothetical protein
MDSGPSAVGCDRKLALAVVGGVALTATTLQPAPVMRFDAAQTSGPGVYATVFPAEGARVPDECGVGPFWIVHAPE